jgi:response regulator RpfG family c-di-GMP phosphodiesterase
MIALGVLVAFVLVCVGLLVFHLPAIRMSRMYQIGRAISSAVESRSPFMDGMYSEIVDLSEQLSLDLGLRKKEIEKTKVAALVCDIGLCSVPSAILQKTEEWSPDEQAHFDRHADIGASILRQSAILKKYWKIVQHHHTKFEVEPSTPIASRIIGVSADYVRYKRVYGAGRAMTAIERQSGIQYDPDVVNSLKELISVQ